MMSFSDDTGYVKERLGRLILTKTEAGKSRIINKKIVGEEKALIEKSIEYLNDAYKYWGKLEDTRRMANVQIALFSAYEILEDFEKADGCIKLAYELDSRNDNSVLLYANFIMSHHDVDYTILFFEKISDFVSESVLLIEYYAGLLYKRNEGDDREDACKLLIEHVDKISVFQPVFRFEYLKFSSHLCDITKGLEKAKEFLANAAPDLLSLFSRQILIAGLYSTGDKSKAIEIASDLVRKITEKEEWYEKRNLALLLQSLGQWDLATSVWSTIISSDYICQDTFFFIECAKQSGQEKNLLDFCALLRKNHLWDDSIVDTELSYREMYDIETAIQIINDYLDVCEDDEKAAMMRLRLSYIGLKYHRHELLEADKNKLPSVESVHPQNGILVVNVLELSPKPIQAIEYAYELWRIHPNNEEINQKLILLFMFLKADVKMNHYEVVCEGVAVHYRNEITQEEVWHIIEDSDLGGIDNLRNEYSSEHPISRKMIGKKKGDTFIVDNMIQSQSAVILDIRSKYLFRSMKCHEDFFIKFPESKLLAKYQAINMDGSFDFATMENFVKKDCDHTNKILELYQEQIMPLYLVGKFKNKTEYEALCHFCCTPELEIKTCLGAKNEYDQAVIITKQAKEIVIDMSALATLLILDDYFWMQLPFPLLVSCGTYNTLQSILDSRSSNKGQRAFLSYEKGHLIFENITDYDKYQQKIKKFIQLVHEHCIISNAISILDIDSIKRNQYIDIIGQSNLEATILAGQSGRILWTDDLILAYLAANEFGCKRTWTQVVSSLVGKGAVARNLQLYLSGYQFTRIGIEELVQAVNKSEWKTNKYPLCQVLEVFSDDNVTIESQIVLFQLFVKYLWQNGVEYYAQQITLDLLNRMFQRTENVNRIQKLPIHELFGIDCINAVKVQRLINEWLRLRLLM